MGGGFPIAYYDDVLVCEAGDDVIILAAFKNKKDEN